MTRLKKITLCRTPVLLRLKITTLQRFLFKTHFSKVMSSILIDSSFRLFPRTFILPVFEARRLASAFLYCIFLSCTKKLNKTDVIFYKERKSKCCFTCLMASQSFSSWYSFAVYSLEISQWCIVHSQHNQCHNTLTYKRIFNAYCT